MIYALIGPEALLLKRALDKLLAECLDPASKDFNYDVFEGGDLDVQKVIQSIGTLPVFAPRRVVLVKNAHELKKAEQEKLANLLSDIPESTDLIFTAEKSDARTGFWQKLAKAGKTMEFKPIDPREAPRWIADEAAAAGYKMDYQAAQWLASAIGADLSAIQSALQKLFLLKGDQKTISLADAEACVSAISWRSVFDLTDAVGAKNLSCALQLFHRMEESGESPIGMLSILARHFRILSKVKEGDTAGVPPFFLRDYQRQAGPFDAARLQDKREKIFQADWALKSSPIDNNLLFERLLMELCR